MIPPEFRQTLWHIWPVPEAVGKIAHNRCEDLRNKLIIEGGGDLTAVRACFRQLRQNQSRLPTNFSDNTLRRYLETNTTWYLQSHFAWDKLWRVVSMLYSSLVQRIKPPKEGRYRTPAALKALRVSLLKPVASPFVISVMIFILQELPRAKAVITLLCLFCVTLYAQKNKPLTPAPKAPSIIFTDIAPKSNFAYRTNNNYVGKKYFPQPMCGGVAVFDYNNDGWKDFYSANGDLEHSSPNAKQYDSMFENQGGKMFTDVSVKLGADFMHSGYQRGSAFSDLNNDGWLDLVVTSLDAMLNAANNKAHWLLVKLIGKQSNCDSIGAKIKVTTASGRTLFNHVTTSAGFMSSSDLRAHFGLGNESVINAVEIIWPNGAKQILRNVMADKILQIEEPMTGTKIKD